MKSQVHGEAGCGPATRDMTILTYLSDNGILFLAIHNFNYLDADAFMIGVMEKCEWILIHQIIVEKLWLENSF